MHRALVPHRVALGPDDAAAALVRALAAALDGSGPALAPVAGDAPSPDLPDRVPADVALVLTTSGSTGVPRHVLLDAAALRASAAATRECLGGPARWVLALPPAHVAGVQVLVRSVLDGTSPVVVPPGPFDPRALADAVRAAGAGGVGGGTDVDGTDVGGDVAVRTSLVPTQLHRVVSTARTGALPADDLAALRALDAVLVGGAAIDPALLDAARDLGLRVVTTYGMTETCGGCVYDGVPLAGVRVRAGTREAPDVVRVAGPVLARGYLPADDGAFEVDDGARWLVTRDLGALDSGRLSVLGRVDDVIVTGGYKVAPAAVEAALAGVPGVGQVCVVGVADEQWGRAVVAVVVPDAAPPALADLRAAARTLGRAAAPHHLLLTDALPERGPGKVDRAAVAAWADARLAARPDPA